MSWWAWSAVFLLILAAGSAYILLQARRVWRTLRALQTQAADAAVLVAAIEVGTTGPRETVAPRLAVFDHPATVRRERAAVRRTLRDQRRRRREATLPGWARR